MFAIFVKKDDYDSPCKCVFAKFVYSVSYVIWHSRIKNYQNLTTESGSKQRFSLLQEKVVICRQCA